MRLDTFCRCAASINVPLHDLEEDMLHSDMAKEQAEWIVQLETGQVVPEEKGVTFAKIRLESK